MNIFFRIPEYTRRFFSLRFIIPISVFIVFLVIASVSLIIGFFRAESELLQKSREFVTYEVERLAYLAEEVITLEPKILEETVSRLSKKPLIKSVSVIKPDGNIVFSSNASLRDGVASEVIPYITLERLHKARKNNRAYVEYIPASKMYVAIAGYSYTQDDKYIKGVDKGLVFLSYDIAKPLSHLRVTSVKGRMTEIISFLLMAIILAELLRRYIVSPLKKIQVASRDISEGVFNSVLKEVGPVELQDLTRNFNLMNDRLAETVSDLDKKTRETQNILDNTFDGIISMDEFGDVLSCNASAEMLFQFPSDEIIGKNIKSLFAASAGWDDGQQFGHFLRNKNARYTGEGREIEGVRKDGSVFLVDLAITEIVEDGKLSFIGIVRDITARKEKEIEAAVAREKLTIANKQLENLVRTDGLTGVSNRRWFNERFQDEFRAAKRHGHQITLLLLDVDHFKKYNDHYGHLEGDTCLVKIAHQAHRLFRRGGEMVARYGGEEFAIILPGSTQDDALRSANVLLEKIADLKIEHAASSTSEYVTVSIGLVSSIPHIEVTEEEFIKAADEALYQAKEAGRARVVTYQKTDKISQPM